MFAKKIKPVVLAIAGAIFHGLAAPSIAQTTDPLQGLWAGNDPSDGGLQTWSIAATDVAGEYQVRLSDTYLRACSGNRGSVLGKGKLDQDGNLIAELKIQCLANPTNEAYIDPIDLNFVFKPRNGYLEGSTASSVTQLPSTLFKTGFISDNIEGIWSGTDPDDSGLQTWIIVRKGKAYQVRANDTYLRTCTGNRGSILGKGTLDQDGNLSADMEIQCHSNPTNERYLAPVHLNFSFKWTVHGYLEVSTSSGVTQPPTTLFKTAEKTALK
ncbi:MAG: hypothetical protein Q7U57_09450 [Methylovulum sp.]|nr:hypothetical protein [Methylovulum sp.]